MHASLGYTPLGHLWSEFAKLRFREIYVFACDCYDKPEYRGHSDFGMKNEFGSPKDLAEQIFIETIRPHAAALCSPDGTAILVPTQLANGLSDIFQRMLVFESTIASEELALTPTGYDWLTRMGSPAFSPWPHKLGPSRLWPESYPAPDVSADLDSLWKACRYHRLPMWFERDRFVVAQSLPPWAEDAIDVAFAKTTAPHFRGWSLCLERYEIRLKHILHW